MLPLHSLQNKPLIKNAIVALTCTFFVALPFPYFSYNSTFESVVGKITGGLVMFILVFLTQNKSKEDIAISIINIKWIGLLIPFILLLFIIIGQLHLDYFGHALFGVIFFNLVYFSRLMQD
ncbi:MAG: hypothetical protein JST20_09285 [Bacteroidetes bacterium]|nr:hypothetical protein [Bacteroidota bacterium]